MVAVQTVLERAGLPPNWWSFLDGMEGPKPLCWGPPGCLGDPSDLDKVQVGFTTVIPILSLTSAQVVSCTA